MQNIMNRIILLLLVCVASFTKLAAQTQDPFWFDYCDGNIGASITQGKTSETVEMAICFTQADMARFADNQISSIAVGWPTSGKPSGDITVWVREAQDGANVVSTTVAPVSGWNAVTLDQAYDVDGTKDVWVGVTFKPASARVSCIGLAGTPSPHGSYYRFGTNGWASFSSLAKGNLAIRAGFTGSHLPKHDAVLYNVRTARTEYAIGDDVRVNFSLTNAATDDCTNPIVRCSLNGNVVAETTVQGRIAYGKSLNGYITVPTTSIAAAGVAELTVEVLWADGEADMNADNNVVDLDLSFVDPVFDLSLVSATIASRTFQCGDPIGVTGSIKNLAGPTCVNPVIRYSLNGGAVEGEATIKAEVAAGKSATYAIVIPSDGIDADATVDVTLTLAPKGEGVDTDESNNVKNVNGLDFQVHPFIKRMLVEEFTGTWCGFCPMGIVSLKQLTESYPERFIAIAVHTGDEYAFNTYNPIIPGGVPSCYINRGGNDLSPSVSTLKNQLLSASMKAKAQAELKATAWVDDDNQLSIEAEAYFAEAQSGKTYNLLFALTEDHVIAKEQANYYAGGSRGAMGGFELLPDHVPNCEISDVAHGLWPSLYGDKTCQLSGTLEAEKPYMCSYKVNLNTLTGNTAIIDPANVNVVAFMLDNNTGAVVNATRCKVYGMSAEAPEGIGTVLAPTTSASGIYNLAGQRAAGQSGIVIKDGRKMIVK